MKRIEATIQINKISIVSDAITGYIKTLINGRSGEAYNIGTSVPEISIAEFAEKLEPGRLEHPLSRLDLRRLAMAAEPPDHDLRRYPRHAGRQPVAAADRIRTTL